MLNSIRWGSIIAVAQFDDNVFGKLSDETTTEVSPIEPTKEPADSKAISIADFDLIRVIGRGSYAKVLMVELKKTRRLYAMKVIKKELVTDDEVRPCVKIHAQWLKIRKMSHFDWFSNAFKLTPIGGSHSWTKPPGGVAVVNQVDQLTHQVVDVTIAQLMTTPYSLY